jgi:hypothetical protein
MLYSYKNQYPKPLPFRITLSDGRTRTDPSSFTPEEIEDAEYIPASSKPAMTSYQVLEWDSETVSWVVRDKTEAELQSESNQRRSQIDSHRDQRILQGFVFNDVLYDSRPEDQKRISASLQFAFMAISAGAQANDLRWLDIDNDFVWIAKNNTLVPMDAFTVIEFAKAAVTWEKAHIFAARALKDMTIVPVNFMNNEFWPSWSWSDNTVEDILE